MSGIEFGLPDRVVHGSRVITMHPDARSDATGVAIRGERIIGLLGPSEISELAAAGVETIDAGDRVLMPGFVDVHAHSEVVCRTVFGTVDCRAPECSSIADIQETLGRAAAERAPGDWIVGQGNLFFDRKIREGRLPTRQELDEVSTEHPIAVRAGGHVTVLNAKALEVAGIDRDFVPPEFSVTGLPEVERDDNGNPTGVVKEMDTLLPFPGVGNDELQTAIRNGLHQYFTRYGVTTIGEISETVEGIEAMGRMAENGDLPVSMRIYLWAPGTLDVGQACEWSKHISLPDMESAIRIQGIKLFADGGFSARSAAVSCPYIGTGGSCGNIAFADYFFQRAFEKAGPAGLQLSVHANGDRAQEWLCQQVAALGGSPTGRQRTRIEHAGNFLPRRETIQWWAHAGIIPVPQPVFLYTFGEYFPDYLGDFGREGRFAFKTLIEEGWKLSGSSDVWIGSEREATNPFFGIWCCVKRETFAGSTIDTHEAVTREQAIRMHTLDAAAVLGEDDVKGSIAPGKFADIIAVDGDPFEVPVDELRRLSVDLVLSRGKPVLNGIN